MVTWENNGSIRDVSDLSKGSIGVKTGSMAATNTVSVIPEYGAPGTQSESSSPDSQSKKGSSDGMQDAGPFYSDGPDIQPGDNGKPKARNGRTYAPGHPVWKPTSIPDVVREG